MAVSYVHNVARPSKHCVKACQSPEFGLHFIVTLSAPSTSPHSPEQQAQLLKAYETFENSLVQLLYDRRLLSARLTALQVRGVTGRCGGGGGPTQCLVQGKCEVQLL